MEGLGPEATPTPSDPAPVVSVLPPHPVPTGTSWVPFLGDHRSPVPPVRSPFRLPQCVRPVRHSVHGSTPCLLHPVPGRTGGLGVWVDRVDGGTGVLRGRGPPGGPRATTVGVAGGPRRGVPPGGGRPRRSRRSGTDGRSTGRTPVLPCSPPVLSLLPPSFPTGPLQFPVQLEVPRTWTRPGPQSPVPSPSPIVLQVGLPPLSRRVNQAPSPCPRSCAITRY